MEQLHTTAVRDNVDLLEMNGRKIYLVGTAHVSQASADLAEEVIRDVKPDSVAVELCDSRLASLQDPDRWKNMDIVSVIKHGKAYVLMTQLILAGFQKKLGNQLHVKPGAEMLRAVEVARDLGAETVMADRDIRTTLKRTWASLGLWGTCKLLVAMLAGLFGQQDIDEEEIERLKNSDALEELMREFSEALPGVRVALIDERDQYLAAKIKDSPGGSVVAIVGAGHVPGIKSWISKSVDTGPLEIIPPPRRIGKIIGWGIPILVLSLIAYGFSSAGAGTGIEMFEMWFWVNAILAAIGAIIALAHPVTIVATFFASPFTSLNPMIGVGWVAGLVEAMMRKPRVSDLETIADDVGTFRGMWTNRVSRILLVMALTTLFGAVGTFVGLERVLSVLR